MLGVAPGAVQRVFTADPAVLAQLHVVWPLLVAMQVPNAGVFGFDGFIAATRSFAWVRNVLFAGVALLLAPGLALTASKYRTLLALWCAKAVLNAWRLATAFVLIYVQFWRKWGGRAPCDNTRARQGSGEYCGEKADGGLGSPLLQDDAR